MSNLTKKEIENLNQIKNGYHLQVIELENSFNLLQKLLNEATKRLIDDNLIKKMQDLQVNQNLVKRLELIQNEIISITE
ncbi:hypothetical protein UFOVP831_41 [uncultured Caudovirales phage]|uniref:Uncharacterized protein n=1 Tax=uncultured Caudovirales phage TaxID=2100421 RepID=A0A6J5NZL7_9CAUD|nr:hypothetical protein UFOVP831_41 [uncultured Caudovirales phage]